jgi:hypothetical protein
VGAEKTMGCQRDDLVLRMAGWTLYSLANTNGTIPWGRAAWKLSGNSKLRTYFPSVVKHDVWHTRLQYTWTIAMCRRTPRSRTAREAAAMTAGAWTHEEPDSHSVCSEFVPTGNDPRLQCHEQAWKLWQL